MGMVTCRLNRIMYLNWWRPQSESHMKMISNAEHFWGVILLHKTALTGEFIAVFNQYTCNILSKEVSSL